MPSAADLLIMEDGQHRLIMIFDPPWNPQLAWLWFLRIAASRKWGPTILEVILGLLLKPQRIPIVFASIENDWKLCFCAVSGAGISSPCTAFLANFSPSFHSRQLLMRALNWCCEGCMVSTLPFRWHAAPPFFFLFFIPRELIHWRLKMAPRFIRKPFPLPEVTQGHYSAAIIMAADRVTACCDLCTSKSQGVSWLTHAAVLIAWSQLMGLFQCHLSKAGTAHRSNLGLPPGQSATPQQ